jgi:hypothetical protein
MQSWKDPIDIITMGALVAMIAASGFGFLYLLVRQFSRLTHLRLRSLSFYDLWVLARSADDRAEIIKEFYDWQRKLLLAVITGLIGFIAANVVLVVQATVGTAEATKAVSLILNTRVVGIAFGVVLMFLLLLTISLPSRLGRIPDEYRASINLYERMR